MNDPHEDTDEPLGSSGAPGVPPPPSVTPGSAPPPPGGARADETGRRGCLLVVIAAVVVGLVAVTALVVVLLVARDRFGDDAGERDAERREVVDETGIETGSTDIVHPPQRDIRLGACEFDAEGGVRASGTLTNWTDEPSDYRISLSFRSGEAGDTEFGATVVTVEGVEPLSTTNWGASVPVRPEGSYS